MRRPNFACIFAVNRMAGITDNTLHVAVCRNNITEIIGYIQLTAGLRAIWPDWGQIASEETSKGKGEIKIARARSRENSNGRILSFYTGYFGDTLSDNVSKNPAKWFSKTKGSEAKWPERVLTKVVAMLWKRLAGFLKTCLPKNCIQGVNRIKTYVRKGWKV